MADEIVPDYAERLRAEGWSMRAALVRYAQPEPVRASAVLTLMRRLDAAMPAVGKPMTNPALWEPLGELDTLGDVLAVWAVDRAEPPPNDVVDRAVVSLSSTFERLGVPEESMDPEQWRGMRSREGRRAPRGG